MAITTITGRAAVTSGNLDGTAVLMVDDKNTNTRKSTLQLLRTKMFAGSTGFTAADPLNVGPVVATASAGATASMRAISSSGSNGASMSLENSTGSGGVFRNWAVVTNYNVNGAIEWLVSASEGATPFGASQMKLTKDGALTVAGGVTVTAGGMTISSGTLAAQAVTATTLTTSTDGGILMTGILNYAGSAAGTLTNAPVAGNPTIWLKVSANGAAYHIPLWG